MPLAWCQTYAVAVGYPEPYGGVTPTDWQAAAQLHCNRFSAQNRVCTTGATGVRNTLEMSLSNAGRDAEPGA